MQAVRNISIKHCSSAGCLCQINTQPEKVGGLYYLQLEINQKYSINEANEAVCQA